MKKYFITIASLLLFSFSCISAQSYEIGISVGKDIYEISNLSKGFQLQDLTEAKLSRTGFSNPVSFGLNFGYNSSKKYAINFEADFNYLEYDVDYTRNVPQLTDPFYIKTTNYKVPWARLGTMLSFNYVPYSLNGFDLFVGGGLGLQIFAPAVSDKFIYETLLNKLSELDTSTDIDLNYSFSQKINAGFKYRIDKTNINITFLSSYTFVNNAVYEAPSDFLGIKLLVNYLF